MNENTGHGHVKPRPDGRRARCGGPNICKECALEKARMTECIAMTPESLARKFHETYERLSPQFGYSTREETREFDPDSPNGKLMVAVCAEIVNEPPI